jgi:hypothetical protein
MASRPHRHRQQSGAKIGLLGSGLRRRGHAGPLDHAGRHADERPEIVATSRWRLYLYTYVVA